MDGKVRPLIRWLVLATMGVVAGFISWQSYRDNQTYTMTPKKVLADELTTLPVPTGVQSLGDLKLTDRQTFYYAEQRFSSSVSRDAVTRSYKDSFRADGWRLAQESGDEFHSLWFCKNGVLASIDFFGGADTPRYKLSLTTGGWVIRVCG